MSDPDNDLNMSRMEIKLDKILSIVESMDDKFKDHEERLKNLETFVGHHNLNGRKSIWGKVLTFFSRDPLGSTAACVLAIVGVVYILHNVIH